MKFKETIGKVGKKVKDNKKTIAKAAIVTLGVIGGAVLLNNKNKKDKTEVDSVDYSIEPESDDEVENDNSLES